MHTTTFDNLSQQWPQRWFVLKGGRTIYIDNELEPEVYTATAIPAPAATAATFSIVISMSTKKYYFRLFKWV